MPFSAMVLLAGGAATLGARVAGASSAVAPALSLRCDEGLAFSPAQLEQALSLRMPAGALAPDLHVMGGADASTVEVILGDKRRSVALGERRGGLAARWVALTIVDLILGEAAPPQLPQSTAPPPPGTAPRAVFLLYPTISIGLPAGELLAAGGLGGSVRLYRRLRWTLDVSYGGSPDKVVGDVDLALKALPLRSGPAFCFERLPIELRLSALVAPYWVHASMGQTPADQSGVLGGLTAAGYAYLPPHRYVAAVLSLGVDLFINQTEFLAAGQPVLATPRFTAWLGAGLALRSSL